MSEKVALSLEKVRKTFSGNPVVDELTLSVAPGEIYALIGPNGAGKTTTVKMATGLLTPTSGVVKIFGLDVAKEPVGAKKELGFIPDDPFVYEYLSGREFLRLTGDLYGLTRQETEKRTSELLSLYNLQEIIDGLFSEYSRGNKQKTVILANLLHRPKLLLVDEPIVGLDVQSQKVTLKIFTDFVKQGGAILVTTHTLGVAQELAHRIGILNQGKLVEEGSLAELRKKAHQSHASLEDLYLKITGETP